MTSIYLKRGDTLRALFVSLLNPDGSAADLTAAVEVWMHIALENRATRVSRQLAIEGDPTLGVVKYQWQATDWTDEPALIVGTHRVEYEVVGGFGERETYPNGAEAGDEPYDLLVISQDLGQA
jgi:hypothetical protein